MANKELEKRAYLFEVRADDDAERGHIITGRAIVYGEQTDIGGMFAEIIEPGALDDTDLTDVRFLINHDLSRIPLARSRRNNANSTLQLTVDENGLAIKADLDTENNADARSLYSAVQRGDISGMSFLFSVGRDEWENADSDYPTRHIKQISSVVEVSAVTLPAYSGTEIDARSNPALESARAALESAQKAAAKAPEGDLALLKAKTKILLN